MRALSSRPFLRALRAPRGAIVFVGSDTWKSYWVPHEVQMTLDRGKPVYAIRLNGVQGKIPSCLTKNGIKVYPWSEANLQALATM